MERLNEQDKDSSKGIRDAASGVAQRLDLRLDFPCLDGVRALAALLVLINHSSAFASGFDSGWSPEPVRIVTGLFGRIGVATFFVISGFLLYRPFVLAHLSGVDGGSAGRFWVRRFARILPGYWIALLGAIALGSAQFLNAGVSGHLTAFGLAQNYRLGGMIFLGIAVAWTLVIEASFYIFLPGFAWVMSRFGRSDRHHALRAQIIGLSMLVLIALVTKIYWLVYLQSNVDLRRTWFPLSQLGFWLPAYLDWFAVGMLLALCWAWRATGGRLPRLISIFAGYSWFSWLVAAGFTLALTRIGIPLRSFAEFGPMTGFLYDEFALCVGAFLVLPALFAGPSPGMIRRILASRLAVFLGTISFGIYLWNATILDFVYRREPLGGGGSWFLYSLISLVATLFISYIVFILAERPIRDLAHKWSGSSRLGSSLNAKPSFVIDIGAEQHRLDKWVEARDSSRVSDAVIISCTLGLLLIISLGLPSFRGIFG